MVAVSFFGWWLGLSVAFLVIVVAVAVVAAILTFTARIADGAAALSGGLTGAEAAGPAGGQLVRANGSLRSVLAALTGGAAADLGTRRSQMAGHADELTGARGAEDTSTVELFQRLSEQTTTLVRQEIELALAELRPKARKLGVGVTSSLLGVVVVLYALGALTACFIAALTIVVAVWWAALITAGFWGILALALVLAGLWRGKRAMPLAPEQTIESTREDVEWAKTRAREARR